MTTLLTKFRTRMSGDRGATVMEFGLFGAMVAVVIIASFTLLGADLGGLFSPGR